MLREKQRWQRARRAFKKNTFTEERDFFFCSFSSSLLAPALAAVVGDRPRPLPRARRGAAHPRRRGYDGCSGGVGSVCGNGSLCGGCIEVEAARRVVEGALSSAPAPVPLVASCCSLRDYQLVVRLDAC